MLRRKMIIGSSALGLIATSSLATSLHRYLQPGSGPFAELAGLNRDLIPDSPHQETLSESFERLRPPFTCTCFAQFSLEAVVLSARVYGVDRLMPFSTVDLALGWGPMSNPVNVAQVEIWQRGRFYYWTKPGNSNLTMQDIVWHSANMHMIPANPILDQELRKTRQFDVVSLSGYLCDVRGEDGFWRSSRTRTDTGAGACEIIWVESFRIFTANDLLKRIS